MTSYYPVPDDTFTEGDLMIISSDGVSFMVDSDIIFDDSDGLRELYDQSHDGVICLYDTEYETEHEIRKYLKIVTEDYCPVWILRESNLADLLQFIQTHFCSEAHELIGHTLVNEWAAYGETEAFLLAGSGPYQYASTAIEILRIQSNDSDNLSDFIDEVLEPTSGPLSLCYEYREALEDAATLIFSDPDNVVDAFVYALDDD